jgi:integrase/recombinase XerD
MAKHTRKKPQSVDDRLRCLSPHIDGFKTWLHQNGYREVTITELVRLLACWADWSHTAGFDLDTIQTSFVASAAIFQGGKTARAPRGAGALFIDYLRTQGTLPVLKPSPSAEETWPLLAEFQSWMREQRGVVDSTLDTYRSTLVDLLKALGKDPSAYSASAVRAFVLDRAKPHGRGRAQCIAVAKRAFLKFLVATGRCPVGRDHAVPRFANWRLASTPRYLAADGIDRVIDACDGEDQPHVCSD